MREGEDILASARVMVVGCGALGNEVLKNLALCGVGHLVCVDFDKVEKGNLTRSVLFRETDAESGRFKVDVVKERLLELRPGIDVSVVNGDRACDVGLGLIGDMDVLVACVDNRWARFMINRHCIRMNRPWVDGGIALSEGTVRVFEPGRNCYACSLGPDGLNELGRRVSCANVIRNAMKNVSAATTSISASIAGAVQAGEVLKLLAGGSVLVDRMFYFDTDVPEAGVALFGAYDEDCPEHEAWGAVESSSLGLDSTVEDLQGLSGDRVELHLRDDCFVDYVVDRDTGKRHVVMAPGRKVAEAVKEALHKNDMELSGFYQNEYRCIGGDFPYRHLTLGELGIPRDDVLRLSYGGRLHFVRMR